MKSLLGTRISRPELFKELRSKNIYQLGKVKRVYLEASGDMSIYQSDEEKPGLSVLPSSDPDIQELNKEAGNDLKACCCCGNVQPVTDVKHTHAIAVIQPIGIMPFYKTTTYATLRNSLVRIYIGF